MRLNLPRRPDVERARQGVKDIERKFSSIERLLREGYDLAQKQEYAKAVDEAGRIFYEVTEKIIYSYPWFIRCLIGRLFFSKRLRSRMRKRAAESQKRLYPSDYVYTLVEGDGKEFDFGVDYTECATCKFLNLHGAPELAPYICLCDEVYSEAFGWGLVRTTTIAEGSKKCDFRFKRGGKTGILSRISRSGWSKRLR